jgi:hypothetical protein
LGYGVAMRTKCTVAARLVVGGSPLAYFLLGLVDELNLKRIVEIYGGVMQGTAPYNL